jgi:Tfp pilus assembly protein PilX
MSTMGMLRIMSKRGDDRVTWDQRRVAVGDRAAEAAVREAERIFADQRARGATAFRIDSGKAPTRIETFDATAEQIVMVPRVIGG